MVGGCVEGGGYPCYHRLQVVLPDGGVPVRLGLADGLPPRQRPRQGAWPLEGRVELLQIRKYNPSRCRTTLPGFPFISAFKRSLCVAVKVFDLCLLCFD